jgi:hypothetical protein
MMNRRAAMILCGAFAFAGALLTAEDEPNGTLQLSAALANVTGAPDTVRIEILRWSTDSERERLLSAWNLKAAPSSPGRGAAKAGKGAPPATSPVALIPEAELARVLQEGTTVGYLWSSELSGYALRYAGRVTAADGSQRIVLLTQRRLGAMTQKWNPASGTPNTYEFSVIEIRLNAKGEGEGKASLTGKVSFDPSTRMVGLENYEALPAVFRDVRPAVMQR